MVGLAQVKDKDEVMLVTNGGMLIRMKVKEISVIGRNTQGVRLITLESAEEKVAGISKLPESEEEEAEGGGGRGRGRPGGTGAAGQAQRHLRRERRRPGWASRVRLAGSRGRKARLALAAFLALGVGPALQGATGARAAEARTTLTVQIAGFRTAKGSARAGLWRTRDGFPKRFRRKRCTASWSPSSTARRAMSSNVEAGEWAIAAFHDENDNGELDLNFLGIPKEGYGVSRGARGHFGPPSFDDAKQVLGAQRATSRIAIRY